MKTMSKSDFNKINNLIKEKVVEVVIDNGEKDKIVVLCKNYLPLETIVDIVDKVVIFATNDGDDYNPEFVDMALGRYIIEYLTNIPLPMNGEDVDYEKCYDIYTRLCLYERMSDADPQIDNLLFNISDYIQSKIEQVLTKQIYGQDSSRKPWIIEHLNNLVTKVSEDPEYINKLIEKATEKYLAITETTQYSDVVSSFQDNIAQLRQAQLNSNE